MKYMVRSGSKTSYRRINADIAHTAFAVGEGMENCVTHTKNMVYGGGDFLCTRGGYFVKALENSPTYDVGIHDDKLFYTCRNMFYYNGKAKFTVNGYRKSFYVCGDIIVIYPDLIYYNTVTGKHGKMGKETGVITFKVLSREVEGVSVGLSCLASDDAVLTSIFEVGDKILVTNKEYAIDGYHIVTEVDTENDYLFFKPFAFGEGMSFELVGNLRSGSPITCETMCVCSDRLWMISNGKIYASAKGNPLDWHVKLTMPWSYEASLDMIDKIHHCVCFGDTPLLFSDDKIYRVRGNDANDYHIECVCDGCGLIPKFKNTIGHFDGDIVYMSRHGLLRFDGKSIKRAASLPFSVDKASKCIGTCDGRYYYAGAYIDGRAFLYMYDVTSKMWYFTSEQAFTGILRYKDVVYANTSTKIYAFADACELSGFNAETIPSFEVKISISTNGMRPVHVVLDCDTGTAYSNTVRVLCDGEAVCEEAIEKALCGEKKIQLLPRVCKRLEIIISGSDRLVLRHAYVEALE